MLYSCIGLGPTHAARVDVKGLILTRRSTFDIDMFAAIMGAT